MAGKMSLPVLRLPNSVPSQAILGHTGPLAHSSRDVSPHLRPVCRIPKLSYSSRVAACMIAVRSWVSLGA